LLDGVLVVDKPAGPTSHDVVDRARRVLGVERAGHTGTLDPFATGVLAVCLGKATRLVRFLSEGDKQYRATVRLGFATTTDDLQGEPLSPPRSVSLEPEAVRVACASLTGTLRQVPPAYSAKRQGGKRLYELAREGVAVAPSAVSVTIHRLDAISLDGDRLDIEVQCSPGTYVRAIARDLGEKLAVGGHLIALRRLRSGEFGLDQAVAWEALQRSDVRIIPMRELLRQYPAVQVGDEGRNAVRHGHDLEPKAVIGDFPAAPPARVRVLDASGELVALAVPRGVWQASAELPAGPVLHPDVVLLA
jgi:tRNA pseudouridine55 synthase